VKNINEILKKLIPPADYQHRNGFSNESIILNLDESEKKEVEKQLISMLELNDDDLIGETLVIMKSISALPNLRIRLDLAKSPASRILWASYINELKGRDEEMIKIALLEFEKITEKYTRIGIFHCLSRFQDSRINEKIRKFINHEDYLTAYNARTSLGLDPKEIIERDRSKNKRKWWEFWKK
jgi:hypothetical protein